MFNFKKYLNLFLLVFLIVCCTHKEGFLMENSLNNHNEYLESNSFKILSSTYPNLVSSLDFQSVSSYEEKGVITYAIKSKKKGQPLGVLYYTKNYNGQYKTIIELYYYDKDSRLNKVNFNNIFGKEILTASLTNTKGNLYSLKILNSFSASNKHGWWSCTRGCIGDAWGICANDPECDYLCALAGGYLGCSASIATACAIWCTEDSDNDLTPENN